MGHSLVDNPSVELPIVIQPNIGLDGISRQSIIDILNVALSDEIILATKTRSLHWNVRGPAFFQLQAIFDSQHQQLGDLSDEIAERAKILGGYAFGSLRVFLEHTRLSEQPGAIPDVMHLLVDHEAIIRFFREDAKKCIEEFEDEGTYDLLVSAIRLHQKMAWNLRSYIEVDTPRQI